MKGKGEHLIVCRKHNEEITVAGRIYIPPSVANDGFFEAVVINAGMYGGDYEINADDRLLIRTMSNKLKIGKTKEGDIYAVEYEDVLCSLESDDDSTVFV